MLKAILRRLCFEHRLAQLSGGSIDMTVNSNIARITINQPGARNALTGSMMLDLKHIVDQLEPRQDIKAIILTGEGDKAFCAGSDLRYDRLIFIINKSVI